MSLSMVILENFDWCCGCGACEFVCTAEAICMDKDEEGFIYPIIDEDKCVSCGKCTEVCPVRNVKKDDGDKYPQILAAYAKDESLRRKSSSGGGVLNTCRKRIRRRGSSVWCCIFR